MLRTRRAQCDQIADVVDGRQLASLWPNEFVEHSSGKGDGEITTVHNEAGRCRTSDLARTDACVARFCCPLAAFNLSRVSAEGVSRLEISANKLVNCAYRLTSIRRTKHPGVEHFYPTRTHSTSYCPKADYNCWWFCPSSTALVRSRAGRH